tara:strand:- start:802 stop:978 length:177 start_codon:yes stop_codon:yes gene_type:complete
MANPKKYTRQEIDSNINILKTEEDQLVGQRKELNQLIRDKRKALNIWVNMDESQYKAF